MEPWLKNGELNNPYKRLALTPTLTPGNSTYSLRSIGDPTDLSFALSAVSYLRTSISSVRYKQLAS